VFLIEGKNVKFLHSALFHKSNQNDDEISFFILVDHDNYENYVELRNRFDEWVKERDRNNLKIRVMDGEDIDYTRDNTWDDLCLPEDIKNTIKRSVEDFLSSKD